MGIPKFYRQVRERNPMLCASLDASAVAPRVDYLYLDMNGVVHNCARGASLPGEADTSRYHATATTARAYADTFLAVFKYVDMLFSLVSPRRVVYLAVDGVAPRAKMNQQRSRRFRSAQERADDHARKIAEDPMYRAANVEPFDSNCITPGTQFMAELTDALKYFAHKRVSEDAAWAGVEVVVSGAEAPGEGEHKIMEYIRAMKLAGRFQANARHCVYGLDADLIMLGLVAHEPHFVLLREKIDYSAFYKKKNLMRNVSKLDTEKFGEFELLSIGLLREYLAMDVGAGGLVQVGPTGFDIEKIVNDFVFIAMMVGNDFLPHIPTIEMADGALGTLLHLYKRLLPRFGGYISDKGVIEPKRFELFALSLGVLEGELLVHKPEKAAKGRFPPKSRVASAKSAAELDRLWGFQAGLDGTQLPEAWSEDELDAQLLRLRSQFEQNKKHMAAKRKYYISKLGFDRDTQDGAASIRDLCSSYVEGVVWTLKYYFEGCADWRWYYPYHYAPVASDLVDMADMMSNVSLTRGTPFKPMEQLLSVLPPSSGWCLPKPYRLLMTHPSSPIRDNYPLEFQTDMNGKRNDWEAVVLLPFLDEDKLMSAMATIPVSDLTPAERVRNSNGVGVVFSRKDMNPSGSSKGKVEPDSSLTFVPSPFPGRLPSLSSLAETKPLELPHVVYGVPFPSDWVDGTVPAGSADCVTDLPTFFPVPHSGRLRSIGVNVFGQPAKHESMLISLGKDPSLELDESSNLIGGIDSDDDHDSGAGGGGGGEGSNDVEGSAVEGEAVALPAHWQSVQSAVEAGFGVGKVVWVGYPWRLPAVVHGLSDEKRTIERTEVAGGGFTLDERPTKAKVFRTELSSAVASLMDHRAVMADAGKVLIRVCVAIEKDALTGVPKTFATKPAIFSACSITRMNQGDMDGLAAAIDRRRLEVDTAPPDLRSHELVMCVDRKTSLFGCMGRVSGVSPGKADKPGEVFVSFPLKRPPFAKEPAFGYRVVSKATKAERWFFNMHVAKVVKLPPQVLSSITGSVRVKVPGTNKDEIDVGLGIKYSGRGLFIPGYARPSDDGRVFLLSEKTTKLVGAYRKSFPDLFTNLIRFISTDAARNGGSRVVDARELFGSSSNATAMLRAAASWVATSELSVLPLVAQDASVLPKESIVELEAEVEVAKALREDAQRNAPGAASERPVGFPRSHLISGRESDEQYAQMVQEGGVAPPISVHVKDMKLGDRVANRRATGPIPFGLRGTVVGIHPAKSSEEVSSEVKRPRKPEDAGGSLIDVNEIAKMAIVEVVFDEGFIGGGDLGGRCSDGRGKAVPRDALFQVRPAVDKSSEQKYYTQNYSRVAQTVSAQPSSDSKAVTKASRDRKAKAVALGFAAANSYAEAARANTSNGVATPQGVQQPKTGGLEHRPNVSALPIPNFSRFPAGSPQQLRPQYSRQQPQQQQQQHQQPQPQFPAYPPQYQGYPPHHQPQYQQYGAQLASASGNGFSTDKSKAKQKPKLVPAARGGQQPAPIPQAQASVAGQVLAPNRSHTKEELEQQLKQLLNISSSPSNGDTGKPSLRATPEPRAAPATSNATSLSFPPPSPGSAAVVAPSPSHLFAQLHASPAAAYVGKVGTSQNTGALPRGSHKKNRKASAKKSKAKSGDGERIGEAAPVPTIEIVEDDEEMNAMWKALG